jgi:hypothetical protein
VEPLVQRVDERVAIGEVDVEGALGHARLGDDAVDAQAGEAVLLGDGHARVEERIVGGVGGDGSDALRLATDRSVVSR